MVLFFSFCFGEARVLDLGEAGDMELDGTLSGIYR